MHWSWKDLYFSVSSSNY